MIFVFIGKPDKIFPYLKTGQPYELTLEESPGRVTITHPFRCPYSSVEKFRENWRPGAETKQKKDMFGSDSPLYIEIGEVRPIIDKWLTRDLTDPDYQYKITETARDNLIRDVCYLIYRKRQMLARQSLPIQTTPMKPAKKAGQKVKKVNALKKAVTAKSKKLLKAKKK